jgi:outer membrane protein insertion porin family
MQQKNFDIRDPPESFGELFSGRAFRGAGQDLSIDILPGTETQNYRITLSEPALFESDYGGSGTLFFSTRDYDEYDEERYGGRLGVSRRFGTVWYGSLLFRAESITLSNLDPSDSTDVFAVEGQNGLTGLGVEFIRNTTDNRFRPGRGNRIRLAAEQVGVAGGDFDFTKLRAGYGGYFNVHETFLGYRTIFSITTQVDYIPQGQDAAPVFERYYQGGQNFRGFAYRTISPVGVRNDTGGPSDDPVGGTFSFFLGAEINQPLYKDIVSMVAFIDSGTVNTDPSFDNYRVSVGLGVRLYIQSLSPVPIAFDFGFPIKKEPTDEDRLFSFSIDLPY